MRLKPILGKIRCYNFSIMEIIKNVIGLIASIVGVSIMLPQIFKSIKTKSVVDISWGMLILYCINCFLWLIYGILISAIPVIATNAIALVISVFQILLKFKYRSNRI